MLQTWEFSKYKWTQLDIFDLNGCMQMLRNIDGIIEVSNQVTVLTKQICFKRKIINSIHFQFDLNAHEGLWLK